MFNNDSNKKQDDLLSGVNTNKPIQNKFSKADGSLGGDLEQVVNNQPAPKTKEVPVNKESGAEKLFTSAEIKTLSNIIDLGIARKLTSNKKVNDKLLVDKGVLEGIKRKLL